MMIDPKEFTDPFDLDRAIAGEDVYSTWTGALVTGYEISKLYIAKANKHWRMRPKAAQATSGRLPYGAFVCWDVGGKDYVAAPTLEVNQGNVYVRWDEAAWKATQTQADADGWIKCEGKCPDIAKDWKTGTFECRLNDGDIVQHKNVESEEYLFHPIEDIPSWTYVVAIRRLPSANVEPINTSEEHIEECVQMQSINGGEFIWRHRHEIIDKKPYKPFLNETWEIAGRYLNGVVERRLVEVDRDVALALVKR